MGEPSTAEPQHCWTPNAPTACDIGGPLLRSSVALRLASAMLLGDALTWIVTCDHRPAGAARQAGLAVTAPGA